MIPPPQPRARPYEGRFALRGLIQSLKHWDESPAVKYLQKRTIRIASPRRLLSVSNALILLWICLLWWGERLVFRNSLTACQWNQWEQWVSLLGCYKDLMLTVPPAVRSKTTSCCAYSRPSAG